MILLHIAGGVRYAQNVSQTRRRPAVARLTIDDQPCNFRERILAEFIDQANPAAAARSADDLGLLLRRKIRLAIAMVELCLRPRIPPSIV